MLFPSLELEELKVALHSFYLMWRSHVSLHCSDKGPLSLAMWSGRR